MTIPAQGLDDLSFCTCGSGRYLVDNIMARSTFMFATLLCSLLLVAGSARLARAAPCTSETCSGVCIAEGCLTDCSLIPDGGCCTGGKLLRCYDGLPVLNDEGRPFGRENR